MSQEHSPGRLGYSVARFAEAMDIGRSTIYEEIRAGRLKVLKIGARTIITDTAAKNYLKLLAAEQAAA